MLNARLIVSMGANLLALSTISPPGMHGRVLPTLLPRIAIQAPSLACSCSRAQQMGGICCSSAEAIHELDTIRHIPFLNAPAPSLSSSLACCHLSIG